MGKKTGRSRGRPSRIPSEQSKFLASFWSSWDDARAANDRAVVSSFYNDLATKYLEKFGPPGGETPTPAATPSGTPNPDIQRPSDVDSTFDINTLDPALRNIGPNNPSTSHASTTLSASPPGAGIISPPSSTTPPADPSDVPQNDWGKTRSFIVGWFNHHGKKNAKSEVQEAGSALLNTITNVVVKKPVKSSILIAYQREYYDARIRSEFEDRWLAETTAWQEALESGHTEGLEAPVKVKLRTQVAKAAWERETQEFREDFIRTNEEQHATILELFERRNEAPESPEDYANALEHLPCVVNDLVQGLARRFGMVASILMCGPIPTKGGTIDVVSMHSSSLIQGVSKSWPQFDPDGYELVETKLRNYGRRVFSKEQQLARALPDTILDDGLLTISKASSPTPTPAPEVVPTRIPAPDVVHTPIPAPDVIPTPTPAPGILPAPTPAPDVVPALTTAPDVVPAPTAAPDVAPPLANTSTSRVEPPALPSTNMRTDAGVVPAPTSEITSAQRAAMPDPLTPVVPSTVQKCPSNDVDPPQPQPSMLSSQTTAASNLPPSPSSPLLSPDRSTADGQASTASHHPPPSLEDSPEVPLSQHNTQLPTQPPMQHGSHSTPNLPSSDAIATVDLPPAAQQPLPELAAPPAGLDLVELDRGCIAHLPQSTRNDYKSILYQEDWGIIWTNIVALFATFELKHVKANLPTDMRPREFAVWMKYGRKDPSLSTIPLETFPTQFREWWQSLQPSERGATGHERPTVPIPRSSWFKLARSGRNGLYLLLLGLFWWRHACEALSEDAAKSSARKDWNSVAIDLLWVMSTWTIHSPSPTPSRSPSPPAPHVAKSPDASPSKTRKRKRGDQEASVRGSKRKR